MSNATPIVVRGKGPRDGFPDYVIKKFGSDQLGIFHGTAERHHKIGEKNQRIDPKWASVLYAPDPGWGIPCVDVDGTVRDAMYIAEFRYEGLNADAKFDPTDDQKTFSLEGVRGDKAAELHPDFQNLKKIFGWDEINRWFPEFLPKTTSGQVNALKIAAVAGQRSKLAFVNNWISFGLTYKISYAAKTIPSTLLSKIGTIIKSPPNIGKFKLPSATQDRRWLVTEPDIVQRGSGAQITESYLLGEPGGMPEAMYGAAAFSQ